MQNCSVRTMKVMNSTWFKFMAQLMRTFILILILGSLAACGRAGPLQPPSATVSTSAENAEEAEAEEAQKPDRPFILDGILN